MSKMDPIIKTNDFHNTLGQGDVLTDIAFRQKKQDEIINNLTMARAHKAGLIDEEYKLLIKFAENRQNDNLDLSQPEIIESVTNYIPYIIDYKVGALSNYNFLGDLKPLNADTVAVHSKLKKLLKVTFSSMDLEGKITETMKDKVTLGDGYLCYFKTDSPFSLTENFNFSSMHFKKNTMGLGVRIVDPRKMLLDPGALDLHEGTFVAEENRTSLMFVEQVLAKYYGNRTTKYEGADYNLAEIIKEAVITQATPAGSKTNYSGEYLEGAQYDANSQVVNFVIYFEKAQKGKKVIINRYYLANGEIIGFDSDIKPSRYPYSHNKGRKRRDTPYCTSDISLILPIHKAINKIESILLTLGIQNVTPAFVLDKETFKDYSDEELEQSLFDYGSILKGDLMHNRKAFEQLRTLDIPDQLIKFRDILLANMYEITALSDMAKGTDTGSLQKKGAVDAVLNRVTLPEKVVLGTNTKNFVKDLHLNLMGHLQEILKVDDEFVVEAIDEENGFEVVQLSKTDLNKLMYYFHFDFDTSPKDRQAKDEEIALELLKIDTQYNKENPIRIITPTEVMKSLAFSHKADILERIARDIKAHEEQMQAQQMMEQQMMEHQAAMEQAQMMQHQQELDMQQQEIAMQPQQPMQPQMPMDPMMMQQPMMPEMIPPEAAPLMPGAPPNLQDMAAPPGMDPAMMGAMMQDPMMQNMPEGMTPEMLAQILAQMQAQPNIDLQ